MTNTFSSEVGLVIIGRNEGMRLRACLESVVNQLEHVIYVDSGSTDGSVPMAKAIGVHVVELDMSVPFTAGRARNEGWRALLERAPNMHFVQFVDGDCTIVDGWLSVAHEFLITHQDYAIVAGRLRERFPERSIYNQMCDQEWDTPVGDMKACGGIAMMRLYALQRAGGFRSDLIAGEEPELCVRLRHAAWKIHRLPDDMAWHDADMTRFSQWWRRTVRAGYAYAEGAWLHGTAPERHWVKETIRALFWGAGWPAAVTLLAMFGARWALMLLISYPLQMLRLSRHPGGWPQAFFLVLGKFAEAWGVLRFYRRHFLRQQKSIIEHK